MTGKEAEKCGLAISSTRSFAPCTLAGRKDFLRCAYSAGKGAVHSAVVTADVGSFSGEEERLVNRRTESLLAAFATDFHVAVCATRERIRIPVVKIRGAKLRFNARFFYAK